MLIKTDKWRVDRALVFDVWSYRLSSSRVAPNAGSTGRSDATSDEVALDFAEIMLRRFGLICTMQDSSLKNASKDYYGGIYDSYDVFIGIAPLTKVSDADQWYVCHYITAGMHTKQAPKLLK